MPWCGSQKFKGPQRSSPQRLGQFPARCATVLTLCCFWSGSCAEPAPDQRTLQLSEAPNPATPALCESFRHLLEDSGGEMILGLHWFDLEWALEGKKHPQWGNAVFLRINALNGRMLNKDERRYWIRADSDDRCGAVQFVVREGQMHNVSVYWGPPQQPPECICDFPVINPKRLFGPTEGIQTDAPDESRAP